MVVWSLFIDEDDVVSSLQTDHCYYGNSTENYLEIRKLLPNLLCTSIIGYFWISNAYFAVATGSQFDPVFKARDGATVKTIDRSTIWTVAPSRAFCQKYVNNAVWKTLMNKSPGWMF